MTAPAHRSYSQVNTLRRCGYAYKLGKIDKIPGRPSAAAVGGSAVHVATEWIDSIFDGVGSQDFIAIGIQIARDYFAEEILAHPDFPVPEWTAFGWKPKQDVAWWVEKGIPNCIDSYVEWRMDNPQYRVARLFGGLAIEVPFDVTLGDVQIQGKIDRVFEDTDNDVLFAVDLKTGKKPPNDEQLGLYRTALSTLGVDVTYGIYVYGLKRGTAQVTSAIDLSHWTPEKLYAIYGEADRQIREGIFLPHPGDACFICEFKDHCPFNQSAL